MANTHRRTTLALAVLGLLAEAPMHPYRMQLVLKAQGKDDVANVGQRASLYKAVDRLSRAGLIVARGTTRAHFRPERTVFALTDEGERVLQDWLVAALAMPAREFPELPAAVWLLDRLDPALARAALERRTVLLRFELARLDEALRTVGSARMQHLDEELRRATVAAELGWVESIVDDLQTGRLTWSGPSPGVHAGDEAQSASASSSTAGGVATAPNRR